MKKQFRILAAALALCLSLLCCPAAFAAVDSSSCQTVPYAQATSQPLGQPITITGTPNYSAATSNDTAFIFGFDTADGVWYVAVQKSKFDAFKAAAPAQQMTLYGVYAGTLDVNGMPILDIQNGSVLLNGTTSDTTALYTAGQKKLDARYQAMQGICKKFSGPEAEKRGAACLDALEENQHSWLAYKASMRPVAENHPNSQSATENLAWLEIDQLRKRIHDLESLDPSLADRPARRSTTMDDIEKGLSDFGNSMESLFNSGMKKMGLD